MIGDAFETKQSQLEIFTIDQKQLTFIYFRILPALLLKPLLKT